MSSRKSAKKKTGQEPKKDSKTSKKEASIAKPEQRLRVETSLYDPSTSLDVSARWDTTSSGSSHPGGQLVLDGVLVSSPLPFESQNELTEPKDLYEWALDRVREYEKAISSKKGSDTVSFDFKLSLATEDTTEKTDDLPSVFDITNLSKETAVDKPFETDVPDEVQSEDQLISVILTRTEIIWLLDLPSDYVTDPSDKEMKGKIEARSEKPETREVSTQVYRVVRDGGDDDVEFKVQDRGVQVSRPVCDQKASQCTGWDIFDVLVPSSRKPVGEIETISSLTRIERAVSWNSYGAGILRVTGRNGGEDTKDRSPLSLPIPFSCQKAVVSSVIWHPSIPDLLAVGYSMDGKAVGAVDCWTLKNCSRPERRYHLNRPVVNLAFSTRSPVILVAETSLGIYLADIRNSTGSWVNFLANSSDFGHIAGSVLPSPAKYLVGDGGNPVKIDLNCSQNLDLKLVYEPNGNYCLGHDQNGNIFLYSSLCPNRNKFSVSRYHSAAIVALNWASKSNENENDSVFVSASLDSTLALWSVLVPQKPLMILQTLPPTIIIDSDCLLIPNSRTYVVAAVTPENLHIWRISGLKIEENLNSQNVPKSPTITRYINEIDRGLENSSDKVYFSRVSLLEKGTTIATGLSDGRLVLFPLV